MIGIGAGGRGDRNRQPIHKNKLLSEALAALTTKGGQPDARSEWVGRLRKDQARATHVAEAGEGDDGEL